MLPQYILRLQHILRLRTRFVNDMRELSRTINILRELLRRDFASRFTGSLLGGGWIILQPLALILCYWIVFTIMIPRVPFAQGATGGYTSFLIAGLLPWLGFADAVSRSTTVIVDNGAMVRRLTFRSSILVIVTSITALSFEVIGLTFFALWVLFQGDGTLLLWPLIPALLLQEMIQTGLGWIFSTLQVIFRDVAQIVPFLLTLGLFLSPVFYEPPARFDLIFRWNPMTPLLGLFRSGLIGSPLPDPISIVYLVSISVAIFAGGWTLYRRAEPTIADVL